MIPFGLKDQSSFVLALSLAVEMFSLVFVFGLNCHLLISWILSKALCLNCLMCTPY